MLTSVLVAGLPLLRSQFINMIGTYEDWLSLLALSLLALPLFNELYLFICIFEQ